jgi:hypothetical protein
VESLVWKELCLGFSLWRAWLWPPPRKSSYFYGKATGAFSGEILGIIHRELLGHGWGGAEASWRPCVYQQFCLLTPVMGQSCLSLSTFRGCCDGRWAGKIPYRKYVKDPCFAKRESLGSNFSWSEVGACNICSFQSPQVTLVFGQRWKPQYTAAGLSCSAWSISFFACCRSLVPCQFSLCDLSPGDTGTLTLAGHLWRTLYHQLPSGSWHCPPGPDFDLPVWCMSCHSVPACSLRVVCSLCRSRCQLGFDPYAQWHGLDCESCW